MGDIDLASELAVALAELSEAPQHVASPCPHACAESAVLAVALVEPSEAPEFGAAQWPQPLLCSAAGAVAHSALPLEPPAKKRKLQVALKHFWSQDSNQAPPQPVLTTVDAKRRGRRPNRSVELALTAVAEWQSRYESLKAERRLDREIQYRGGRPPNPEGHRRGVLAGEKSNRLKPGLVNLRRDLPAATKLLMAQELRSAMPEYATRASFWRDMIKKYGKKRPELEHILAAEAEWARLVREHHLGSTEYGRGLGHGHASCSTTSLRMRAAGAGRPRNFDWAVQLTKHWLNIERAYGHNISKPQLFRYYVRQLQAREQTLRSLSAPEPHESHELEEITYRLSKIDSKKTRETWAGKLLKWCNAKCLRPQLTSHLSMLEESIRAMLTWQSFDSALHRCAFGTIEELSTQVARPTEFRAHIGQCILGFSDQVPLWVKETQARSVYASWETSHRNNSGRQRLRSVLGCSPHRPKASRLSF